MSIHKKFKPHRSETDSEGVKRIVLDQPKRRFHALGRLDISYVFKENAYYDDNGDPVSDETVKELGLKLPSEIAAAVKAEAAELVEEGKNVNMYMLYKKYASKELKSPPRIQQILDASTMSEEDKILRRLQKANS